MTDTDAVTSVPPRQELSLGHAAGFVLRALAWVAVLFGLLRVPWVQEHLILPFAGMQQTVGCALMGAPRNAVVVDQSCTGSDAMALAVGAILAFPVAWRKRLTGAFVGLLVVSLVNTVRIGTLAVVVEQRELFRFLHVTAWPAVIIVIAAGYVFAWMQWAQREDGAGLRTTLGQLSHRNGRLLRFVGLTVLFVVLYYIGSIWFLRSEWLLRIAHWATAFGGAVMSLFGVESEISGNFITTSNGRWVVTQECVATPLVAVYLAAVLSAALTPMRRLLAVLAVLPLFIMLGSARLLVLALPKAIVGSHEVAIHAFYQILAGVVVVLVLAARRGRAHAWPALGVGAVTGLAVGWVTVPWVAAAISAAAPEIAAGVADPQGALSILPGYQLGLWMALVLSLAARRGRPLVVGSLVLALFQVLFVGCLIWVALEAATGLPVIVIRMTALLVPLAVGSWLLRARQDSDAEGSAYRGFWEDVGENFPDLGAADSTALYLRDERRLFEDYLAPLDGIRVFKTDLWDEAKNTRILRWAAGEGCRAYGIDISPPIAGQAKRGFDGRSLKLNGVVSDVRAIPYRDNSFDAIYSMGTVEHFDETDHAIDEIFRVLAPGGRAIVGVPNRWDPFLRPAVVALMSALGLYGYGFEKSYSRRSLRRKLVAAGFRVEEETAILFIPGWLRIFELALHAWARPLTVITRPFVALFGHLSRRFPKLQRHGYLLATVASKPADGPTS